MACYPRCSVVTAAALAFSLVSLATFAQAPAPPIQIPAPAQPAPNNDAFGEEVTLTAKTIVFTQGNGSWDKAFETLIQAFKLVHGFLDKQSLKPASPAMTIYTAVTDTGFRFQAAVPVAEAPANLPRDVTVGQSPAGKALKFIHRGSYDSMDLLYEAITNFLDEKRIERQGLFIEEYLTDPVSTPEDKLVVNIYVLVQ
jgi:effector-binding domain-containing protein